ncbi:acylphosphatase [Candidatus Saccharibacteria bacterium SW_7_54_9]|nr:MAG: acylphosphatase [Candidatus Saccharibacteria bacterium SW_7_54_9]
MSRWIIRVHGRVQGVFYRQTALEKARQLGVTGFAQNEPEGAVYIEVEGDENTLSRFLEWCWVGSPSARVDNVETETVESRGYREFTIH